MPSLRRLPTRSPPADRATALFFNIPTLDEIGYDIAQEIFDTAAVPVWNRPVGIAPIAQGRDASAKEHGGDIPANIAVCGDGEAPQDTSRVKLSEPSPRRGQLRVNPPSRARAPAARTGLPGAGRPQRCQDREGRPSFSISDGENGNSYGLCQARDRGGPRMGTLADLPPPPSVEHASLSELGVLVEEIDTAMRSPRTEDGILLLAILMIVLGVMALLVSI